MKKKSDLNRFVLKEADIEWESDKVESDKSRKVKSITHKTN